MLTNNILTTNFFNRDAKIVAKDLLGKVIYRKYSNIWLSVRIIETEAYYISEKGSHAFLGYTEKRKALFMKPGTIYMYYSRAGDSMNISTRGKGNAVLIKSGYPYIDEGTDLSMIQTMQRLNPDKNGNARPLEKLCKGQTLLCKSLNLEVPKWDTQQFNEEELYIKDVGYIPERIIQTTRLGITKGRDEDLMLRFIDYDYSMFSTKNVLKQRNKILNKDYFILSN